MHPERSQHREARPVMRFRSLLLVRGWASVAPVVVLIAASLAMASAGRPVDDDDDDRAEALALAERAFTENCLMCHSAELTTRQRLTPKQWTTEVEKMIGWGTPLPPERKDGLIAWLSATFPVDRPSTEAERIRPETALATDYQDRLEAIPANPSRDLTRGAALFSQHCAACHGSTARGGEIGVNLVTKPILTRLDDFHATLNQGKRRMPSFGTVLDDQSRLDLLVWLRHQTP